ncbi:MAG TPA: hypothetical protein VG895_02575 [Patescibacteria group bacterium]|nr:hypothetical protein [Patescibacteria group bacterium]
MSLTESENLIKGYRENNIVVPDGVDVANYLSSHPLVVEYASKVIGACRREFDLNTQLSLEVYRDQESTVTQLTLYVRRPSYTMEIYRNLDERIEKIVSQYDDEYPLENGELLVMCDFKPSS